MLRRLLTVVIAGGLLVSMPGAAQAATWTWNSRSAPLSVYSNGASGTRLGQGHGSMTITFRLGTGYSHVDFTGRGYLRDSRPGNNSIYWENWFQVLDPGANDFLPAKKVQSTRWNGSSWRLFQKSTTLTLLDKIRRRAQLYRKVCEDRRLASDPCHGGWRNGEIQF
ncbi:MAG: hypothetical protein ACRDOO_06505 [Actinomadura sp.]